MRLIVLFFLSLGVFSQAQDPPVEENVVTQRQGVLTALYHQVYGDDVNGSNIPIDNEVYDTLVQNLATCTYEGQHEVTAVVGDLARADCSAVIQEAFDNGVDNDVIQNAIDEASHSEAAQSFVIKP